MNNIIKFHIVRQLNQHEWERVEVDRLYFDEIGACKVGIKAIGENGGDNYNHFDLRKENVKLFQFAGAFDKNGKPIYQGHLLKDEAERIYEVIQACGSFIILKNEQAVMLEDNVTRKLEIVGDIVQNLDLVLSEEEFNKIITK